MLTALVGAGALLAAGCITEEMMDPEYSMYGRIKADVAYNSEQTVPGSNGNYVQYVDDVDGTDTLAVTSRESRLGIKFKQGDSLSGKVEVDLYGGTVKDTGSGDTSVPAENKPTVLLRHLFVKMKLAEGLSVLAGQTGDVFSPILPAVLNYGWGWNAGNTGYRRPQVRLEYARGGLVVQTAAARAIGGEDSASADLQTRVAYVHKDIDKKLFEVGVSGVYGYRDAARENVVSGGAVDFQVFLGPVVLRGEYFAGKNLSSYLGGVGQGLNFFDDEIHTEGAWIQVGVKLPGNITVNAGYMYDNPDNADLTGVAGTDDRTLNESLFANVRFKLNEKSEFGLEFSTFETKYWNGVATSKYDCNRMQASLIFKF